MTPTSQTAPVTLFSNCCADRRSGLASTGPPKSNSTPSSMASTLKDCVKSLPLTSPSSGTAQILPTLIPSTRKNFPMTQTVPRRWTANSTMGNTLNTPFLNLRSGVFSTMADPAPYLPIKIQRQIHRCLCSFC